MPVWFPWTVFSVVVVPHIIVAVLGRPDWSTKALAAQFAIMAALMVWSALASPRGPNVLGILVTSLIFLPFAGLGNVIARLTERWIWKRNSSSATVL
jgi:hypothetical protein